MRWVIFLFLLAMLACQEQSNSLPTTDTTDTTDTSTESPADDRFRITDKEERYAWQKPEFVIDRLGDIEGKVIADIGAGTGYFAFRLMRKAEKVIAIDIDTNMINVINNFRQSLDDELQPKIETRLALADDPKLSIEEVDIAIIINTIGYIDDRATYLRNLKSSLKDGGEVMIVDFKMKRIPDDIAPSAEYRVNLLLLEELLEEIGYSDIITDDTSLEYQFIVQARKGNATL